MHLLAVSRSSLLSLLPRNLKTQDRLREDSQVCHDRMRNLISSKPDRHASLHPTRPREKVVLRMIADMCCKDKRTSSGRA